MNIDFNKWWNEDDLTTQGNPFTDNTPAYWAWEGWCAGVKAEREACAKVIDEMAEDMVREMEPSTAIAYVRSKATAIRARGQA